MLISCLLPTYNRFPQLGYLVEEAIECFLRQSHKEKELLLLNDCPMQNLRFHHPQVRIINTNHRYPTLGEKLHWMLQQAQGEYICRWDDDDISLPDRLETSMEYLQGGKEWRPENHWYYPRGEQMSQTLHPGNTHIMSIWHRNIILDTGVNYPGKVCPSGLEDQTFNQHLWNLGYPRLGSILPPEDIFYIYRWGTGSHHLSGAGGGEVMQQTYQKLATAPITPGVFELQPHWREGYGVLAQRAADTLVAAQQLRHTA